MDKWKGKYRIESARASWWDYSNEGAYFITICTHLRQHFFGKCTQNNMELSPEGCLAEDLWYEIPNQFPNIVLGEFVVMPNHIHGVLIFNTPIADSETRSILPQIGVSDTAQIAGATQKVQGGITGLKNPMLSDNLSRVVRWYKGRCSYEIRKIKQSFKWQTRFWDNIILNDVSFHRIAHYIINNPQNWEADKFYN
jgi:REP element-mobilizing transposase RayT